MTKEDMINVLLEEFERNLLVLNSDDIKTTLERRQRFIKAQLESFGVNTESITNP